ncbi:MAG: holo-ACP synthase [Planctomycetaceae bacterium]|nr:holo-ACP synthase [Planctomycetaceae bacterium]
MPITGLGTDIVECERIKQMLERHGEHFTQRVFTADEIRYCTEHKLPEQHFAGRWAAKEAVLKVLGTGWISGIRWTDVEVVRDAGGKPSIRLSGGAAEVAKKKGIGDIQISISHCKLYAIAVAVGE